MAELYFTVWDTAAEVANGPVKNEGAVTIGGASAQSGVIALNQALTMHFGPEDVLLNLSLDFDDRLSAGEIEDAISTMDANIKAAFPEITRIFIEAESWRGRTQGAPASSAAESEDDGE